MYFTHHFARPETLSRARSWLTQLGFKPHQIEIHKQGIPRLAMSIQPPQWAEVSMLISALERTDPEGFPSMWKRSGRNRSSPGEEAESTVGTRRYDDSAAIGWHPID